VSVRRDTALAIVLSVRRDTALAIVLSVRRDTALAIVLSVRRDTASDYPSGKFKLFLWKDTTKRVLTCSTKEISTHCQ
jgi:hypothetical protein